MAPADESVVEQATLAWLEALLHHPVRPGDHAGRRPKRGAAQTDPA